MPVWHDRIYSTFNRNKTSSTETLGALGAYQNQHFDCKLGDNNTNSQPSFASKKICIFIQIVHTLNTNQDVEAHRSKKWMPIRANAKSTAWNWNRRSSMPLLSKHFNALNGAEYLCFFYYCVFHGATLRYSFVLSFDGNFKLMQNWLLCDSITHNTFQN